MKGAKPFFFICFVFSLGGYGQDTLPPRLNVFQNWAILVLRHQADIDEQTITPLFNYIFERDSLLAHYIPCIAPLDVRHHLRVTSDFGLRRHPILGIARPHRGVDLKVSGNFQFVYATAHGIVSSTASDSGYGHLVVINHPTGFQTRYGHLQDIFVKPGQSVAIGQIVGLMGQTGLATGVHLHYEIRRKGTVLNPVPFLGLLEGVLKGSFK